ncbi:hypothetical protein [Candidatus Tisiphia endosymbiont of Parasteatoda lunata]|uniref:hypothetical protein n=1 Tax=Candidatus Tisiphia endosymbiont of Parasteatoda lunata TaxID=3066275 RepID=UPI00313EADC6
MQIPSITIEQVAQQFKAWRQTKTNKFDPIPNHLKELVYQLLHHYSYQEIAKHLNINKATISSIKKATISSIKKAHEPTLKTSPVSTSNQALQQNINFLPFQLLNSIDTDPVAAPKQNHYTCHIIKPNGTKLIIQTLEPKTIIQTFLCCN